MNELNILLEVDTIIFFVCALFLSLFFVWGPLMAKLKDFYFQDDFISLLCQKISDCYNNFDEKKFRHLIYDEHWSELELKAKMSHVSAALKETLPESYPAALDILKEVGPAFGGFDAMVFPDFVGTYGLEHVAESLEALAIFTPLCSSEFGIRPFLIDHPDETFRALAHWARDRNEHVRRFASEGCRPRLPWAMAIPSLKKDPTLILPILELLKNDPSEYVRRSVANNLNDISKDHPELVLKICKDWQNKSTETDWIIKHACRTLLKQGNREALRLFGYVGPDDILLSRLALDRKKLAIGESFTFSFTLTSKADEKMTLRLEYAIDFVKAKGKRSLKKFQLGEKHITTKTVNISRKHSFTQMTTRKHYPGLHYLKVFVNGREKGEIPFTLTD